MRDLQETVAVKTPWEILDVPTPTAYQHTDILCAFCKQHYEVSSYREGPSTQHLRPLDPKTIEGVVFGTRSLKYWILGPSGLDASLSKEATNGPGVGRSLRSFACDASEASPTARLLQQVYVQKAYP